MKMKKYFLNPFSDKRNKKGVITMKTLNMNLKIFHNKLIALILTFTFIVSQAAFALPKDPSVESGNATIEVRDNVMNINASDKAVINYSSFNIAQNEAVVITLPSTAASILNRDIGGNLSTLAGRLDCNGLFILINTSGIYVTPTATINAGGVILSTRDINTQDFLSSNYIFQKISKDELDRLLINAGTIRVGGGGMVGLLAGAVRNEGKVIVPCGRIVLASGDAIRLDVTPDGSISVAIEEKVASKIYDHEGRQIGRAHV
jgi:filamentous hemagglutinin family protein